MSVSARNGQSKQGKSQGSSSKWSNWEEKDKWKNNWKEPLLFDITEYNMIKYMMYTRCIYI